MTTHDEAPTTLRNRADRALDAHLWLYERHHTHPVTREVARSLLVPGGLSDEWLTFVHSKVLNEAATWTATPAMLHEIALGVDFLLDEGTDEMVLLPEHVPAKAGVVVFPYGIELPLDDIPADTGRKVPGPDGRLLTVVGGGSCGDRWMLDGFAWWTAEGSIAASTDPDWAFTREEADWMGWEYADGVQLFPITRWRGRDNDRPFRLRDDNLLGGVSQPPWAFADLTAWAFHRNLALLPDQGSETSREAIRRLRLFVWLYFAFARDRLPAPTRPSRAAFRRARPIIHENVDGSDPGVLVIRLRHEDQTEANPEPEGAEPRWWRHRWIVQGHKARRRYAIRDDAGRPVGPTRGPDAVEGVTFEVRWVDIAPFEKGPEHMPLKQQHKVHVLAD